MKLGIGLPLTTDREYSQFWDSFHYMRKPDHVYLRPQYRGPIDRVRNEIVKQAVTHRCSHLLFMDTDQVYRDQQMIYKMLEHDRDVVGTVVHRGYPPYDPLAFRFGEAGLVKVPEEEVYGGKLIEVDAMGCGCVLYNIKVFEKLPPPWFEDMSHIRNGQTDKGGPGEDINLCYKLRGMGVQIFVDTSIVIDHLALLAVNRGFSTLFKKLMELKQQEACKENEL